MRDINVAITGTLDASAKTVTFNTAIDKNKLLTIVNTTANVEIYTANDPTNGGTLDVTNQILTVAYDTTSMNDTDLIQVIYEGAASTALATEAKQDNQITQETASATSLAIIDDWDESDRAKVNPIIGQAGVDGGSGNVSSKTQRVVLAADITPPLPLGAATKAVQDAQTVQLGSVTETAPASDTASSGLNGRLQRIAQRLTTLITNVGTLVFGAGTEATALRVTLPTDGTGKVNAAQSGTWTVQPGNTANTTAWKVDGSAVTQPVSGTVATTTPKASTANTPSILTSGGDVIASNASRKSWGIQNLGTNPLFVRMATGASSTVFHWCLGPGQASDDGFGASVSDDTYTGVVSATGTSPRFVVYEL